VFEQLDWRGGEEPLGAVSYQLTRLAL